jgi:hypothetical protein
VKQIEIMTQDQENPKVYPVVNQGNVYESGLNLLDHFAGLAMQGHLASYYGAGVNCDKENMGYLAKSFYDMAQEMLE